MPETEVLDRSTSLEEARRLVDLLRQGEPLEPLRLESVPLIEGEKAYAEIDAEAWRWLSHEVIYERRSLLFGGPIVMASTALVSFAGNRRRRLAAERAASPRWRPLGLVRIVATELRLLVWHEGAWWSVWYHGLASCHVEPDGCALLLTFEDAAPYRLAGDSVALLSVVLAWISSHENRSRN